MPVNAVSFDHCVSVVLWRCYDKQFSQFFKENRKIVLITSFLSLMVPVERSMKCWEFFFSRETQRIAWHCVVIAHLLSVEVNSYCLGPINLHGADMP